MQITVALGGGGSKGIAHLGVLRCLDSAGYQINGLAGTSAGGIIGALYTAGYKPDEIIQRFKQINQANLFERRPEDGPSLLGTAGVQQVMLEMLGERTFADLEIPFVVTATDLTHGREVLINEGQVYEAVLATIAVPGVLPPRSWHGLRLVDGGVLDPVPVAAARNLAPRQPVFAVVLTQAPENKPFTADIPKIPGPAPVVRQLSRLRITQAFQIFLQSVDLGARVITEYKLEIDKPDVVIRPRLEHIGLLDQVDIDTLVTVGEMAAQELLPKMQKSLTWNQALLRMLRYTALQPGEIHHA
jgi:NTE family protein